MVNLNSHILGNRDQFLEELRQKYAYRFIRQLLHNTASVYSDFLIKGPLDLVWIEFLENDLLYDLRRAACGSDYQRPCLLISPPLACKQREQQCLN